VASREARSERIPEAAILGCVPALANGERRSLQGGKPLYRRPWLFLFARARNLESDARLSSAGADLFLTRSRRTCTRERACAGTAILACSCHSKRVRHVKRFSASIYGDIVDKRRGGCWIASPEIFGALRRLDSGCSRARVTLAAASFDLLRRGEQIASPEELAKVESASGSLSEQELLRNCSVIAEGSSSLSVVP